MRTHRRSPTCTASQTAGCPACAEQESGVKSPQTHNSTFSINYPCERKEETQGHQK